MGRCLVGLVLVVSACEARLADPPGETIDASSSIDGPVLTPDAPADAQMLGAWNPAATVPGASTTTLAEDDGTLSSTTLELVFAVADATNGGKDLFYTSRTSPTAAWTTPVKLGFNLTGPSEETPRFSADDLTLYFASNRVAGNGLDVYRVTRTAIGSAWSTPAPVTEASTTAAEKWYAPCPGGRYLVIVGGDIAEGAIGMAPTTSAALSSAQNETGTFLSADCMTAYFASVRSGTNKIYTSTRTSPTGTWSAPTQVSDFAGIGGNQEDPWISPDQRTFMFASDVLMTKDVYISTR